MAKTVVIVQSNYIPWRGYFDMIRRADEFVIYDHVQYTKYDWRNRNIIKTRSGTQWLTVPVQSGIHQTVDETKIVGAHWVEKHIRTIECNYGRAAAYKEVSPWLFERLREAGTMPLLTQCNEHLLKAICGVLGIQVPFRRSVDILSREELNQTERSERVVRLCEAMGVTRHLCGPAAKVYIDTSLFAARGIEFVWMDYEGYHEYPQCWGPFEPRVSIIDLLLNCGDRAASYLER